MRLWSVHPRYLDPSGLTAVWREALLARAVLAGRTLGYRSHPQLTRFRAHPSPLAAIDAYLHAIQAEAQQRGYRFRALAPLVTPAATPITVTAGQVRYELALLLRKLEHRAPERAAWLRQQSTIQVHPLLHVVEGPVEVWERADADLLTLAASLAVQLSRAAAGGAALRLCPGSRAARQRARRARQTGP